VLILPHPAAPASRDHGCAAMLGDDRTQRQVQGRLAEAGRPDAKPHPAGEAVSCPHCKATQIRRSHRRGWLERALRLLGAKMYSCGGCKSRFARFLWGSVPAREGLSQSIVSWFAFPGSHSSPYWRALCDSWRCSSTNRRVARQGSGASAGPQWLVSFARRYRQQRRVEPQPQPRSGGSDHQ
jgi:hypothetical protein